MHIFVEPLPGILLLDLLFGFPHLVVHTSNCTFKNAPFASTFSLVVPCSHESEHIKLMTSLIFNSVLPVFYRQTLPSDEINTFQLEGDQYFIQVFLFSYVSPSACFDLQILIQSFFSTRVCKPAPTDCSGPFIFEILRCPQQGQSMKAQASVSIAQLLFKASSSILSEQVCSC